MKSYNGIELDVNKDVKMAHSIIEANNDVDNIRMLFDRDKKSMTNEQFHAVSALSSILNANYQICNGGIYQYFDNGYHVYRKPYHENDVAHLEKCEQVDMLYKLHNFGCSIFPERVNDNMNLVKVIHLFDDACYDADAYYEYEDDEDYDEYEYYEDCCVDAPYDFDERYYDVNEYIEYLSELYAQYLNKKFDKEAV